MNVQDRRRFNEVFDSRYFLVPGLLVPGKTIRYFVLGPIGLGLGLSSSEFLAITRTWLPEEKDPK